MPRLFCFGLGFVASALAAKAAREGWDIVGTARSSEGIATLRAQGYRAVLFDGTSPVTEDVLEGVTHLLSSIPPSTEGIDPVLLHHSTLLGRNAGAASPWIGYLSTTGVYGDHQGGWVNEETPTAPTSARTRARVTAEAQWLALPSPAHIFRLAGIYGPGRNTLDALRAGTAHRIVKPNQVFCRTHVEDIVEVLWASMAQPHPGAIYNVCDDEPTPPQDVIAYGASLLGIAPPPEEPFDTASLSPMARSFYADNRRVSNRKIKEDLGISLRYPTYREGLRACLEADIS